MNTRCNFTTPAATVALALAITLSLSGCFASDPVPPKPKDSTSQSTKAPKDDATDGSDVSDDNSDTGSSGDGSGIDLDSVQSGESIPTNFPASVPLYKGEVVYGGGVAANGSQMWTIKIKCSDPKSTLADVSAALTAAGFTETYAAATGDSAAGMFDRPEDYSVLFSISKEGDHYEIGYVVTDYEK